MVPCQSAVNLKTVTFWHYQAFGHSVRLVRLFYFRLDRQSYMVLLNAGVQRLRCATRGREDDQQRPLGDLHHRASLKHGLPQGEGHKPIVQLYNCSIFFLEQSSRTIRVDRLEVEFFFH